MNAKPIYSVVVPVYHNEASLPELIARLESVGAELAGPLEVVFVVDGSGDHSREYLHAALPQAAFQSTVLGHSRNFGSFAAIRTGMAASRGDFVGVMAADLQEPAELILEFFRLLATGSTDITVGRRISRTDSFPSRLSSSIFWSLYRRWVSPEMPVGGVDIFACNRAVVDELLRLKESRSSLVGLLYWVGFRRLEVPYVRQPRRHGKSGWSFGAKVNYLTDSVFSFSDLPLRLLIGVGIIGGAITFVVGIIVVVSYLLGGIRAAGYTPLMLVVLFSTFSLLFGMGIVGSYVWRSFENTKNRPNAIVMENWTTAGRLED